MERHFAAPVETLYIPITMLYHLSLTTLNGFHAAVTQMCKCMCMCEHLCLCVFNTYSMSGFLGSSNFNFLSIFDNNNGHCYYPNGQRPFGMDIPKYFLWKKFKCIGIVDSAIGCGSEGTVVIMLYSSYPHSCIDTSFSPRLIRPMLIQKGTFTSGHYSV